MVRPVLPQRPQRPQRPEPTCKRGDKMNVNDDLDPVETDEWSDALRAVQQHRGSGRSNYLVNHLVDQARREGIYVPNSLTTAYKNTIAPEDQEKSPGDRAIEHRLRSIIRWNAMAIILRANKDSSELGGHIASFQSAATLYDIGFGHFWHAPTETHGGDLIYIQGHCSPGIYARAFVEGRLTEAQLLGYRQETEGRGLPSYPHPWLMPEFWQFPTVSMGLGPLMAIYQARFLKYLQGRSLAETAPRKVWAFMGDGEMDEPESLGAISLAGRERLDNLIFVINCNLQRLDGPVRGNGKIIQELEGVYRGAGWNVLKVIWGSPWDELIANDQTGNLIKLMNETVDGEYQKYVVSTGDYIRKNYFGRYPELLPLVEQLSDRDIEWLSRGGHDPRKIYAAYKWAVENKNNRPTVILAHTIKGYGLSEGQGRNSTHQKKKLSDQELIDLKNRLEITITDQAAIDCQFYHPGSSSREVRYLLEKRAVLNGFLPRRSPPLISLSLPPDAIYDDFKNGSGDREVSTTIGYVSLLV